ncbi:Glyoxylate reductase hydroxypyruvate reductase, partial [Temnothorax longispinosus]
KELGVKYVTWGEFLAESDFLVISAPLNDETRKRFNDEAFGEMKKQPVFVNVARGEIVDTAALERALCTSKIFAAGLDVTDPEPLPPKHKLLTLQILPHLGSSTIKTRDDMAKVAALNIINVLAGKDLRSTGPQWLLGRDIRGSTVGIFGLGNIGQEIVKRLKAFEVGKFIHTGPRNKDKAGIYLKI